ncbi:amidohydrolase family protein [Streptomyces alanosinicus]|uniref:6-methylsalicylate decarboxylase n=1 Tax=Streptomyces alanosinicus TaxID=68171 RepID=A0A918YR77_9ACTN|nr:amidohydrolase family protein [Streptomyces alanosinicus]GHE13597.1 amidohydrolase [Streptomyces alanosinicus]
MATRPCPQTPACLGAGPSHGRAGKGGAGRDGGGWIDVHAHLVPPSFDRAWHDAPPAHRDGMPGLPAWSLAGALEDMDRLGVRAAAVGIPSPGVNFGDPGRAADLARRFNTECAGLVADSGGRLGLLACLPLPDTDAALAEIAAVADLPEVHGYVLFTNYDGRYLGDPSFRPVLAELARRRATVLLHPTSAPAVPAPGVRRPPSALLEFPFDTTRCVIDLVLSGSLADFPEVRWIVPHAGATLGVLADRVAALTAAMHPDTEVDVLGALRSLYYDLAGPVLPRQLDTLLRIADPLRLLYGTDLPFFPREPVHRWQGELDRTGLLDERQRSAVARETAATLFPRLTAA